MHMSNGLNSTKSSSSTLSSQGFNTNSGAPNSSNQPVKSNLNAIYGNKQQLQQIKT